LLYIIIAIASILIDLFEEISEPAGWVAFFIIWFIIPIVYIVAFWTWRGQTPGKIALGIKIIRTDGSSIDLERSVLRYVGYIISAFIFMIGYLWIAFDSRKQGIHDKIADTYVIRLPRRRSILSETYG